MFLRIHSPNMTIGRSLRSRLEHCFRIAADPVSDQIRWTAIQLARVNGPLGRPGYRCQISITLHTDGSVFVEELNQDMGMAISRATLAARRAVLRKIGAASPVERTVHEAEVHYVDERGPVVRENHVPVER